MVIANPRFSRRTATLHWHGEVVQFGQRVRFYNERRRRPRLFCTPGRSIILPVNDTIQLGSLYTRNFQIATLRQPETIHSSKPRCKPFLSRMYNLLSWFLLSKQFQLILNGLSAIVAAKNYTEDVETPVSNLNCASKRSAACVPVSFRAVCGVSNITTVLIYKRL